MAKTLVELAGGQEQADTLITEVFKDPNKMDTLLGNKELLFAVNQEVRRKINSKEVGEEGEPIFPGREKKPEVKEVKPEDKPEEKPKEKDEKEKKTGCKK
jgi:hypothetical protein